VRREVLLSASPQMIRKLLVSISLLLLIAVLATVAMRSWLRGDAVRVTVERQATAALGMPVRVAAARVSLFPRLGLDLESVEIGAPPTARVDVMRIATGWRLIFSRRVEGADLRLNGGYADGSMIAGLASLGAAPPRNVADPIAGSAPFTIVSIRSVRIRNVEIVAGVERIPTSLDASLAGDRLDVSRMTARIRDAVLQIDGQLSSVSRREGHFEIRSGALPLDALLTASSGFAGRSATQQAPFSPNRITATITAPAATLGGMRFESFSARLAPAPSGVVLDPLSFDVYDGHFEARMIVDTSRRDPVLDIRGNMSGIDIVRLHEPAAARKPITGRLDARFALRSPAASSMAALLAAGRGSIDMKVRNGRMPGIEVIRQAVIRYANRDHAAAPGEASDAFNHLDASLTLQAGSGRITALAMNTSDFDLTGAGMLLLPSGRIALDADVILSEALSRQAGRDLYRYARQDKRIVLPAAIGGTLSEPAATIDIGEAAGRALRNRVEDEVKSIIERAIEGAK
jgi:uncharacterized protein involved in outer membrane biogenesis